MVDFDLLNKYLTKYGMKNLLDYLKFIQENGKDLNNYNFVLDLESIFNDRKFIQTYEKIFVKIKAKEDNLCLNYNQQFKYKPPKLIDWTKINHLLNDNFQIENIIKVIKENEISGSKCVISDFISIPKLILNYMHSHGLNILKKNQVAVVIMSGGDGSRLGYDGPKGMYPIGMISKDTFFKIFSQKLKTLSKLCGQTDQCNVPLYIMTSSSNNQTIKNYFKSNNYFDLNENNVIFFQQDSIPTINLQTGSFFLKDEFNILKSPNGNGGIFSSMSKNKIIEDMKKRGIKYVFINCIDNPLCKICDPLFIGYSDLFKIQVATKVVRKRDEKEKIGCIAEKYNKDTKKSSPNIVEYTEIHKLQNSKEFEFGSIGIHLFHLEFIEEISNKYQLDYHIAIKKTPYLDYFENKFEKIYPLENNSIKLEMFIFDSFEFTSVPIHCINVLRDEFSPVKCKDGEDSPLNCQQATSDLHKRWLENVLFIDKPFSKSQFVEISSLVSYNGENLEQFCNIQHSDYKYIYLDDNCKVILSKEI